MLTKFYQRGFFNEVGGNAKQTMILFWPNSIYNSRNLSCFYSLANTFCTILYRQTDGRMDKVIPIYPPNFVCGGIKNGKKINSLHLYLHCFEIPCSEKNILIQVYQVDFTVSIKHACKILHFKNNLYVTFDAMRRNTSIKFKPFLALNPIKNVSFYKNIF